jgi:hypothetical protein
LRQSSRPFRFQSSSSRPFRSSSPSRSDPLTKPENRHDTSAIWSGLCCLRQSSRPFGSPSPSQSLPTAPASGAHKVSATSASKNAIASFENSFPIRRTPLGLIAVFSSVHPRADKAYGQPLRAGSRFAGRNRIILHLCGSSSYNPRPDFSNGRSRPVGARRTFRGCRLCILLVWPT